MDKSEAIITSLVTVDLEIIDGLLTQIAAYLRGDCLSLPEETRILDAIKSLRSQPVYISVKTLSSELCGYCAGTAIKSGMLNIVKIEPVKRETRQYSAVTGGIETYWVHRVYVENYDKPFEQYCLAAKVWEAIDRLRDQPAIKISVRKNN